MYQWYAQSQIYDIRCEVAQQLKLRAVVKEGQHEYATPFWARVEKAGLLLKALALYDELAAERAAWAAARRETKRQFEERVEREGRTAEAERLRAELLASGLSQRETQEALVERLQPLDGGKARAWRTPDPWQAGRLFRKHGDQVALLARASSYEDDEDDGDDDEYDKEQAEDYKAWWRVECARRRRDERVALAAARRRAEKLKAATPE
jgi:hypothetical protein